MNQLGLNAQEYEFLKQYTQLVSKFPELKGQFGLARLHNHFELADDEVLHETSDMSNGYSVTKKVKLNQLPDSALPAVLDDGNGDINAVTVRQWCCD